MRRLRVVITGGAVPTLVATLLSPACGTDGATASDASLESSSDVVTDRSDAQIFFNETGGDEQDSSGEICWGYSPQTHFVDIPPAGTPADPGQICAVAQPPVTSNPAARVLLTNYSASAGTAVGFVSIDPALNGLVVGLPTITVLNPTLNEFTKLKVTNVAVFSTGFRFDASWPLPLSPTVTGAEIVIKASFAIKCGDGGTQQVEALTKVDYCVDLVDNTFEWVSSGDACTVCTVIAEMAPSPIVSDNKGDDLPLGRVVRIRVLEVARAGNQVLLFAENDAGEALEIEWRVSGGALEKIADDVMLWTIPDDPNAFGQVAAWSNVGAGVENFFAGHAST